MQKAELEPWERFGSIKEEEFARAVALGLFDYLRKSRSQGYVLSLSGGADSSAIAATGVLDGADGRREHWPRWREEKTAAI